MPVEGWTNVDIQLQARPGLCFDLTKTWPLADESVEEIRAFHILEHLGPGPEKLITAMCEAWRVAKSGAQMHVVVPSPYSDNWFNDCTHVRPITPTVMWQFDRENCREWAGKHGNTPVALYHPVDWQVVFVDTTFLGERVNTHNIVLQKRVDR